MHCVGQQQKLMASSYAVSGFFVLHKLYKRLGGAVVSLVACDPRSRDQRLACAFLEAAVHQLSEISNTRAFEQ